jgi:hypothetical protein
MKHSEALHNLGKSSLIATAISLPRTVSQGSICAGCSEAIVARRKLKDFRVGARLIANSSPMNQSALGMRGLLGSSSLKITQGQKHSSNNSSNKKIIKEINIIMIKPAMSLPHLHQSLTKRSK